MNAISPSDLRKLLAGERLASADFLRICADPEAIGCLTRLAELRQAVLADATVAAPAMDFSVDELLQCFDGQLEAGRQRHIEAFLREHFPELLAELGSAQSVIPMNKEYVKLTATGWHYGRPHPLSNGVTLRTSEWTVHCEDVATAHLAEEPLASLVFENCWKSDEPKLRVEAKVVLRGQEQRRMLALHCVHIHDSPVEEVFLSIENETGERSLPRNESADFELELPRREAYRFVVGWQHESATREQLLTIPLLADE